MNERKVLNALIENLYFSISENSETLSINSTAKFARAYSIAKQLYEYDLADEQEVEEFANKITTVTTAQAEENKKSGQDPAGSSYVKTQLQ